jgi:uncharacterized membrane protein YjgN (DUF898 family)
MLEAEKTQPVLRAERPAARRPNTPSTSQSIDEMVIFNGRAGAIIRHILHNVLFTIGSFGIYSFWSKTRLRRHFLGNSVFLGSRFEYRGSGIALFGQYLVAAAVFGGMTLAYAFAWENPTILAGYSVGRTAFIAGASVLYVIGALYIFHFAAFRASRYFLANIGWRGFNTSQTGSSLAYASQAVPYSLLVVLTLGLAYPFMRNRLQAYKINHARFGRERLHYHGDADPLLRYWLLPWSAGMALLAGIVIAMGTQIREIADADWLKEAALSVHAWNAFVEERTWLVLSGFILFSLTMHWYRSVESLHFANNTTLARLRFVSRLSHADFLIAWINSIVLVAILGAVSVAALLAVGSALFAFSHNGPTAGYTIAVLIFLTLAVLVLLMGSVKWFILHNLLAGASVNGLAIKGQIALDRLVMNAPQAETRREPTLEMTPARHAGDTRNRDVMVNN